MKDDEDDDDASINTGHYPVLPSLVALQQMRNRLHMAHEGKRLMKWSAMATGRELRRIAEQLQGVLHEFNDATRDAFIALARCRYFFHNFNMMVLESVGPVAPITTNFSQKSVAGVRISLFNAVESGAEAFPCLGIEKGGMAIAEAKRAWRELLMRIIVILTLRNSFMMLDIAHYNATKKSNVLGKIIIPRTETTIKYILSELEELAREEFFRLKKVLEIKNRLKRKKGAGECPVCVEERREFLEEKPKPPEQCIVCKGPMRVDAGDAKKRIDLKDQLDAIVALTKEYEQQGIQATNVAEFKKIAEDLRKKLELPPIPANVDQSKLCDLCKKRFLEQNATPAVTPPPPPPKPEQILKVPSPAPSVKPSVQIGSKASEAKSSEPFYEKHAAATADLELGVFETDTKEIVKIVRRRNEDGTITEEKKVIRIRKETRSPAAINRNDVEDESRVMFQSSETSRKSTPYSDKKTIGAVRVPKRNYYDIQPREVQSEFTPRALPIANPVARYCMSSTSMITVDLEFESVCVSLISVPKYSEDVSNNLREYVTSSTEFNQLLNSFEPSYNTDLASTSRKQEEDSGYSRRCSKNTLVLDNSKENKGNLEDSSISDTSLIKQINSSETKVEETKDKSSDIYMKRYKGCKHERAGNKRMEDSDKDRLQTLKAHITHVLDLTKGYKNEGIELPSVENFIEDCEFITEKIKDYEKESEQGAPTNQVNKLKDHVAKIEDLTHEINDAGLSSQSFDNFLITCKDFQNKLNEYKTPPNNSRLEKMVDQIDTAIELSKEAKEIGLVSRSIESFIKCCEHVKKHIIHKTGSKTETKKKCPSHEPEVLITLKSNIAIIIKLISRLKDEGKLTPSVEAFMQSCELTKRKIDADLATFSVASEIIPCAMKCTCHSLCSTCHSICPSLRSDVYITNFENRINADSLLCSSCDLDENEDEFPCNTCAEEKTKAEKEQHPSQNARALEVPEKKASNTQKDKLVARTNAEVEKLKCDICAAEEEEMKKKKEVEKLKCEICALSEAEEEAQAEHLRAMQALEEAKVPDCSICAREAAQRCEKHKLFEDNPIPIENEKCCEKHKVKIPAEVKVSVEKESRDKPKVLPVVKKETTGVTIREPDPDLGYFEQKHRIIIKITRTKNEDGTIKEERETITIKEQKHDPHVVNLNDEDDRQYLESSNDSLLEAIKANTLVEDDNVSIKSHVEKKCIMFTTPNQNSRGFTRKTRSENTVGTSGMAEPTIRQCVSAAVADETFLTEESCSHNASYSLNLSDHANSRHDNNISQNKSNANSNSQS